MAKTIKKKKRWFSFVKKIMKIRYKRPKFIYLGEEIDKGSVIVCNHEGTDSPMAWEMYSGKPVSFWGAYQMNSGLKKMYSYQTKVYYHQKKGWNLFGARAFCLLASPLTNMFYKGLNVISTYQDARFARTIRESMVALENGENIVIFPEKSDNGYQATLQGFHGGVALFLKACLKKGNDVTVYPSYFNKEKNVCLVGKPLKYSELLKGQEDKEVVAQTLCDLCNELGEQTFKMESYKKKKSK
ncbi:MAG: hypothetical protein J6U92_01515 [Clostridia bacterium]|nr:hypothetical protein [Clostridia bacterium]